MVSVVSFAVCGPDAVSDMSGSDEKLEPAQRTALYLCPWCHAHHSEHDWRSFVKHSRKWRERETGKKDGE